MTQEQLDYIVKKQQELARLKSLYQGLTKDHCNYNSDKSYLETRIRLVTRSLIAELGIPITSQGLRAVLDFSSI
jgi:hypothetical protein